MNQSDVAISGLERAPSPARQVPLVKRVARSVFKGKRYHLAKRVMREVTCSTGAIRCRPDFVIIGAQKSGSSSLFFYLQQHPDVMLPMNVTKEVHFFDRHYDRGMAWYRGHFPIEVSRGIASRLRGRRVLTGEATPEYLVHPRVPERIAKELPDTRFIAVLRNPIDRAWSHYQMQVKRTAETRDFDDAIRLELEEGQLDLGAMSDAELAQWSGGLSKAYLTRGIYFDQIERWRSTIGEQRLMIVVAEDLFHHTARVHREICEFLGLSIDVPEDLNNLNRGGYRDEMSLPTRQRLAEFFQPHNEKLSSLLSQQLDWN